MLLLPFEVAKAQVVGPALQAHFGGRRTANDCRWARANGWQKTVGQIMMRLLESVRLEGKNPWPRVERG